MFYRIREKLAYSVIGKLLATWARNRPVVFDVFGTVMSDRREFFKTTDQAKKAMYRILDNHDAIAHTWSVIGERYKRMANDLTMLGECLTNEATK